MLYVTPEIQIPDFELVFEFVRSSGPGGQAVNKVNSKAQLRWAALHSRSLPEGVRARFLEAYGSRLTQAGEILITSDRFRDRLQNRDDCLDKLREMLRAVARPPKVRKPTKPTRGSRERKKKEKKRQGEKKRSRTRANWD